jgi:tetratricopeptide (TPR) repeat protein
MSNKGKPSGDEVGSTSTSSVPTRAQAQQSQLDFELEFFEAVLQRYPDFIDVLRVHGNNLTLKGRFADGLKLDRRLVDLRPHDPLAHYNLACSYSLLKKIDQALGALRKAIELGYRDFRYMREDRDLDSIKRDPRFRQLLREFDPR